MNTRRWLDWALFLGCGTLLGLLFSIQWYLSSSVVGDSLTWSYVLIWVMPDWILWLALAPAIFGLGERFPLRRESLPVAIPAHLAAGMALFLVQIAAFTVVVWLAPWSLIQSVEPVELFTRMIAKKCVTGLLTYWVILGAGHAVAYYRRSRERELRTAHLETQLALAQLQALRMQLHPHFLFNTLHTLSELIHRDPHTAERVVVRLGDLLRASLDGGGEEVSLRREIEFLERYLDIERIRFHDRLSVGFLVDPGVVDARVPNLILQPLVENAIRHGISSRPGAGRVEVRAGREDGMLLLSVRDDGVGLPGGDADGLKEGIGLGNTRARLEQLYGPDHRFELRNTAGGGLEVALAIPYRVGPGGENGGAGE